MSDLWPAAGRVPEVRYLPNMFPEPGGQGADSGCEESQLVSGKEVDRMRTLLEIVLL